MADQSDGLRQGGGPGGRQGFEKPCRIAVAVARQAAEQGAAQARGRQRRLSPILRRNPPGEVKLHQAVDDAAEIALVDGQAARQVLGQIVAAGAQGAQHAKLRPRQAAGLSGAAGGPQAFFDCVDKGAKFSGGFNLGGSWGSGWRLLAGNREADNSGGQHGAGVWPE